MNRPASSFRSFAQPIRILCAIAVFAAVGVTGAQAKLLSSKSDLPANPQDNPVLAEVIANGAKLYPLGKMAGLDGWFIVKQGQVQIAYSTPDNQYAVIGAMFGPGGGNVSSAQVQALLTTNKSLNDQISAAASNGLPNVNPAAAMAVASGVPNINLNGAANPAVQAQAQAQLQLQPGPTAAFPAPGERLIKELQLAAGVTLGSSTAPLVLMVMDPDCPHCRATWKLLSQSVKDGKLQLRMVPIGASNSDAARPEHERAAAELLHAADPLTAWDKYAGGDKAALAGTPSAELLAAVRSNIELTDSWHLSDTPFFIYRGKDGQVKIVQGEIKQTDALLGDLPAAAQ